MRASNGHQVFEDDFTVSIDQETDLNDTREKQDPVTEDFPLDIFPYRIQRFIKSTNDSLNFHPDYTSGAILATAAIAIGKTYSVEVRPGWTELATSYVCLVGSAGVNKSHPLSFCLAPIFMHDDKLYAEYKQAWDEFKYASSLTNAEREALGIEKPVEPVLKKTIVSDVTAEALALVHSNNLWRLGLYLDELIAWVKNFARYNSGSETELWLSNFSSKPFVSDRKGSASIRIETPCVSVVGTIQPGILTEFTKDRSENGFPHRILFIHPKDVIKSYWSEKEIDKDIVALYNRAIEKLLNIKNLSDKSNQLPFCSDAFELLKTWQRQNTDKINKEENEYLRGVYSKLEIYVIRISLILQMLRYACEEVPESWDNNKRIELASVKGAIKAIEYFEHTAKKVYHEIYEKDLVDRLPRDERKLYDVLPELFKTEQMLVLAKQAGLSERTAKYFIKDRKIFKKIGHGTYEKLI